EGVSLIKQKRRIRVSPELVLDRVISEVCLKDPGWRFLADMRRAARCLNHESVNLAPVNIVANAGSHTQRQPFLRGTSAVVHNCAGQYSAVGESDFFINEGSDPGHDQTPFNHFSDMVTNANYFAHMEGTGVDQNDSGDQVPDRSAGSEGYQDARENRESTEEL